MYRITWQDKRDGQAKSVTVSNIRSAQSVIDTLVLSAFAKKIQLHADNVTMQVEK